MTNDRNKKRTEFVTSSNSHYVLYISKNIWHSRMGHPSFRVLDQVLTSCNIKIKMNEKVNFYEACQYGKSHKLPFTHFLTHASHPLDLIHTNLWGQPLSNQLIVFLLY